MAVTVEELEIIVKAKADEALPILEKVQAKLNDIMRKSLPGLQQAAGTAATVTEKAVKNVEKPVKEAVEALDKAATKNRKVKKSAEDAARSLEKEKEKVIGLDATLSEAGDDAGEKITESLEKTAEETESIFGKIRRAISSFSEKSLDKFNLEGLDEGEAEKIDFLRKKLENTETAIEQTKVRIEQLRLSMRQFSEDSIEGISLQQQVTQAENSLLSLEQRAESTKAKLDDLTASQFSSWGEVAAHTAKKMAKGLAQIALSIPIAALKGAVKIFGKLFSMAKKGISALGKLGKSMLSFTLHTKKANGGVQSFGARLRSIVSGALIFNGISAALRKMTEYLKSAILSTQQMRGAMSNLKGAASVAAAPIIQTLTPALSALANAAATVFSYIAKLISLLTGKSISSMKSAAKSMHSYGSAAGSAAKDVKDLQKANNTLGFDELNVIDTGKEDDASSGGGGGADEILPNFDFEGKSTLLDQVLEAIKGGDWEGAGAILAEKANSILNCFDANGWGKRFGKKLQNGISFAYGLITTFDWNSLGAKLAGLVNGTLSQVDGAQVGALLVSKFTIAIRTLGTFLAELDWAQVGQVLSDGIIGACNALVDAIHSVDWKSIGTGIKDMLCNIDWPGVFYAVGSVIGAGFGALWGVIQGAFSDLWSWIKEQFFAGFDQFVTGEGNPEELGVQLITGLLNGIWSVIKGIWDWIYKNIFKPIGDGIADAFDMHSPSRVAEGWGRNIMLGMLNGITAIWTKITAWLDDIKNGFISVWEGIKNALRPIINGIIGFMNGMISGVVSGMNAVIDVLNHLNVHIPDWVPLFGGKSIGFSITPITAPQIPLLATGAVLKEPTLFAGGEYPGANNNPEIVAPESRMKQAFLEALGSANAAGFGGDIVVNVTEDIDGEVLYRNQHRIKMNRGASVGGVFAEAY